MRKALIYLGLLSTALGQTSPASGPGFANYSIMLVNPGGGGGVVLMHNPSNGLEFVPVEHISQAFTVGYAPVRAAELSQFITALQIENSRLTSENATLKALAPHVSIPDPQAQVNAERAERRRAIIQTWLTLQNMNRPQTLNLNVTDCTRLPALCVR